MTFDDTFLSYLRDIHNNDLINILNINDTENNELQLIRHSSYYDFDKFTKLAQSNTKCFSILSTSIQSINAKFNELQVVFTRNFESRKRSLIPVLVIWLRLFSTR